MAPGTGQVSANGAPVRSSGLRVAWRPKSLARLASKTLSGEKGQCGQRLRVHPGNSSCNSLEVKTYKLKKKGGGARSQGSGCPERGRHEEGDSKGAARYTQKSRGSRTSTDRSLVHTPVCTCA